MDSPHLLHWGFLLLALAAPCPNIAMSTVGPAEGTEDSSSDSTTVTVYYCKGCKRSICKSRPMNFEKFEIISDVRTELTNETHITVCFEQGNSSLEGIYSIVWEKAGGEDHSCGIISSGENGQCDIRTEKKNICCEAEIGIWRRNPTLKCYSQKSCPKLIQLSAGISGNPEFLTTSKKSNIGILLAFLFVGLCTGSATTYYFLRLRRGQAFRQYRQASDRENLTEL